MFALGFLTWRAVASGHGQWASNRLLTRVTTDKALDRVLVADPPRSVAVVARRVLRREPAVPLDPDGRVAHVEPLRLRRADPRSPASARRSLVAWERQVKRAADRHGLRHPALLTNNVFVAGLAELPWAGPVTYYGTDDWLAHPRLRPWQSVVEAAYEGIRDRGRRVCAVSPLIVERIAPTGPHTVVPNGIDPGEWISPGLPPAWFAQLPAPRAVYVGTLDRRLDTDALRAAAEAVGGGSVVLVGGGADEHHLAELADLPSIHRHGDVGREELTAIVRAADVGLLPHARSPLTEAMSPLKLYEYLAAGLPVAATDLPPVRGVHPLVSLADGPAGFAAAVRRALATPRMGEAERLAFVREQSWERRQSRILSLALS